MGSRTNLATKNFHSLLPQVRSKIKRVLILDKIFDREKMVTGSGLPGGVRPPELKKGDITPALVIFIYCACYAVLRLLVSPGMELDEAEQFLNGSAFHLGYARQAPLYTWIVWLVSLFSGRGLVMLVLIKYSMLFAFYLSFYLLARHFRNPRESLIATGSLLLFPIFSYECNRDLSNTVLVALMAVVACIFFLRILMSRSGRDYMLFGVACGLGVLSKYNFVLFLLAVLLYGATAGQGRRALSDKKMFLSLLCFAAVMLPHLMWLSQNGFPSVSYAYKLSRLWLPRPRPLLRFVVSVYSEVILFLLVFLLFMGKDLSFRGVFRSKSDNIFWSKGSGDAISPAGMFPVLALYGLALPLIGILAFDPGHFQDRWLTPVYFTLPLAGFSILEPRAPRRRTASLGYLCLAIAVLIFLARAIVGFFPDLTGKAERIHIPYASLSRQLEAGAREAGIGGLKGLPVLAPPGNTYIAANVLAEMPGARYVTLADVYRRPWVLNEGGILVYAHGNSVPTRFLALFPDAEREAVSSPYLHTDGDRGGLPPYKLEALIIPPGESRKDGFSPSLASK